MYIYVMCAIQLGLVWLGYVIIIRPSHWNTHIEVSNKL